MLEGSAKVTGDYVTYDPQNPENPEFFDLSGSTAKHLSYVLNSSEIRKLTGEEGITSGAMMLLDRPNVDVVVVKQGAFGAKIVTKNSESHVPAYETPYVWSIGSGDVFAAVYSYYWGEERLEANVAAKYASRAAAIHCSSKVLPIRRTEIEAEPFIFPIFAPTKKPDEVTIYLAGPFFTMGQLWLVEEARIALLAAGYKVFSPYHDVGIGDAASVVPQDIAGIEEADIMLALCDGLDPGTLFEIGYAVKKDMPIVAFGEQTPEEAMKMLVGTGCEVLNDFTSAIYRTQWNAIR